MTAHRQVALLRGINVGQAKRIAMADLRALVAGLGYDDVSTLLNSGNIVFTNPAGDSAASRIEQAIASQIGVTSRVTVLTADEIAEVVADNPLTQANQNPSRFLVAVFSDPADRARIEPLLDREWGDEALALGSRVAYAWCPGGVNESRLLKAIDRAIGDAVTSRNWSTITKLAALANETP